MGMRRWPAESIPAVDELISEWARQIADLDPELAEAVWVELDEALGVVDDLDDDTIYELPEPDDDEEDPA